VRDTTARIADRPEKQLDRETRSSEIERVGEAAVQSRPNDGPTDGEFEKAIVDAVTMGLGDVARTLAMRLDDRRRATTANVVALADERARREPKR
jgi:surface antigen